MREQTQFNHVLTLLKDYDFSVPFHHSIKNYFRQQKQLGSRDRRLISSLCYNYFRIGKSFGDFSLEQKITLSNFLLDNESPMQNFLNEKYWDGKLPGELKERKERIDFIQTLNPDFSLAKIFPFKDHLSEGINYTSFLDSFCEQPMVWIRVRRAYLQTVLNELDHLNITFITSSEQKNALGFPPTTRLTELKSFENGWFEIQDLSSQKTGAFLPSSAIGKWWDCCSGAGGKTLMLADMFPSLHIQLSDVRENILQNAKERLKKASVRKSILKNVDSSEYSFGNEYFDGIVADVPCTGSGTWARTPENLWGFKEISIKEFVSVQKKILSNIIPQLKKGGHLLYITCSLFKEENEGNIEFVLNNFPVEVETQKIIPGYSDKADTMFACLLRSV